MRMLKREPPWCLAFFVYGGCLQISTVLIVWNGRAINWLSAIPVLSITLAMTIWGIIGSYRYIWKGVDPKNPWIEPVIFLLAIAATIAIVRDFGGIIAG